VRSIPKLRLVLPPPALLKAFETAARPLRRKMETMLEESRQLSILRDAILPGLMSGELTDESDVE
jgi:hypothetical protein